jgi:hypothetical protein
MATRPVKTAGSNTYTGEVSLGASTIKASEVDADFAELYSNITNVNVAAGAAIAYSKLNLANSIATGDLADGAVTTAKIAAGAVSAANGKIPVAGTIRTLMTPVDAVAFGQISTTETTLVTSGSTTFGGSQVIVAGYFPMRVIVGVPIGTNHTIKVKLYGGAAGATLLKTFTHSISRVNLPELHPWGFTLFYMAALTGPTVFKVKLVTSDADLTIENNYGAAGEYGTLYAVELG